MIFLITQLVPGFQCDSFCQSYSILTLAAGYSGVFLRLGFEASKVHVPLSLPSFLLLCLELKGQDAQTDPALSYCSSAMPS